MFAGVPPDPRRAWAGVDFVPGITPVPKVNLGAGIEEGDSVGLSEGCLRVVSWGLDVRPRWYPYNHFRCRNLTTAIDGARKEPTTVPTKVAMLKTVNTKSFRSD